MIPKGFLNQLGFAMWTPTTRRQHSRIVARYQTDLTDGDPARDRAAIAEAQRDRAAPAADARDLELHLAGIKSAVAGCGQGLSWVKLRSPDELPGSRLYPQLRTPDIGSAGWHVLKVSVILLIPFSISRSSREPIGTTSTPSEPATDWMTAN